MKNNRREFMGLDQPKVQTEAVAAVIFSVFSHEEVGTRPANPTCAREMEKDLALHASAFLNTLLSSIHAAIKRRTNSGGYCKIKIAMGAYRDEKIQFRN